MLSKKNKLSITSPASPSSLYKYQHKFDTEIIVKEILYDILNYKSENASYLHNKIALVFQFAATGDLKAIAAIIRWYYYGLTASKEINVSFISTDKLKAIKLMTDNPDAIQETMVDIYINDIIIPLLASPNVFTMDASTFLKIKKPLSLTDQGQIYLKIINNFVSYSKINS